MDGCRLTMGVSITSSLHVFTNPESMKPELFSMEFVVCFDLFSMIFHLMSGSCQLDRASNVEIGVECQIFVIVIFFSLPPSFTILQFGAHSRYYNGALTQKREFLVICTTLRSDFCVS